MKEALFIGVNCQILHKELIVKNYLPFTGIIQYNLLFEKTRLWYDRNQIFAFNIALELIVTFTYLNFFNYQLSMLPFYDTQL